MKKTMILMTKWAFLVSEISYLFQIVREPSSWQRKLDIFGFPISLCFRCYECASDGCVTEDDLGIEKLCKAEAQVCFVGVGGFGREKFKNNSPTIIFYFVHPPTFIKEYVRHEMYKQENVHIFSWIKFFVSKYKISWKFQNGIKTKTWLWGNFCLVFRMFYGLL